MSFEIQISDFFLSGIVVLTPVSRFLAFEIAVSQRLCAVVVDQLLANFLCDLAKIFFKKSQNSIVNHEPSRT